MARGTLSLHTIGRSGTTTITFTSANSTDDHQFDNSSGKVFLMVKNSSGGAGTVTFHTSATVDGLDVNDLTVSVADGATAVIGPFPKGIYNQSTPADMVYVDPSLSGATFQLAAIKYA